MCSQAWIWLASEISVCLSLSVQARPYLILNLIFNIEKKTYLTWIKRTKWDASLLMEDVTEIEPGAEYIFCSWIVSLRLRIKRLSCGSAAPVKSRCRLRGQPSRQKQLESTRHALMASVCKLYISPLQKVWYPEAVFMSSHSLWTKMYEMTCAEGALTCINMLRSAICHSILFTSACYTYQKHGLLLKGLCWERLSLDSGLPTLGSSWIQDT